MNQQDLDQIEQRIEHAKSKLFYWVGTSLVAVIAWSALRIVAQVDTMNQVIADNLTRVAVVETHISRLTGDVEKIQQTIERFVVPALAHPKALDRVERPPPEASRVLEEVQSETEAASRGRDRP